MRPPASFSIGSTIGGSYTIEGELGRGGMGIVLLASHVRLPEKKVAIKVLDVRLASDEMLARFKREAHIVSVLVHPNIVHVEDYNVTPDGTPYLVLECLKGESLAQRIARGPVDVELALSIARQIGSALATAHTRGIVHRDLKPQNIFLVPTELDGRIMEVAKVLDFGISKLRDSETVQTDENALLGTPQYMAPEQATGQSRTIDLRSDVFSLGAIVYEMLSGKPAFSGAALSEVVYKVVYEQPAPLPADVPPHIAAAVGQAMAKAPAERFGSVSGFIEALTGKRISTPAPTADMQATAALAQTLASVPPGESPLVATLPNAGPPSRKRAVIAVAVGAVVVAAALITVLMMGRPRPEHLGKARMKSIAAQLFDRQDVEVGGHRYPIRESRQHLKLVKFELGGHGYEAIEQNPEKQSEWGALARAGHRVVHFRDLATNRYIAVTVDGEARSEITELQPDTN